MPRQKFRFLTEPSVIQSQISDGESRPQINDSLDHLLHGTRCDMYRWVHSSKILKFIAYNLISRSFQTSLYIEQLFYTYTVKGPRDLKYHHIKYDYAIGYPSDASVTKQPTARLTRISFIDFTYVDFSDGFITKCCSHGVPYTYTFIFQALEINFI